MSKQYQGLKRFVDPETNKDVYMNMIENDDSKRNGRFFITHLAMICSMIDVIGNKKMDVVKFILKNMNKTNNELHMTVSEISKKTGISKPTVIETLKALEDAKIIRRETKYIFMNPELLNNRNASGENYLCMKFYDFDKKEDN